MKIAAKYGNLLLLVDDDATPDSNPMETNGKVHNVKTGETGPERPVAVHLKFGMWEPVVPFKDFKESRKATESFFFGR